MNQFNVPMHLQQYGLEATANACAEKIISLLPNDKVAKQFLLEEAEAASQGNDEAISFVKSSGFSESEYKGAMQNSMPEVDGAGMSQQTILSFCMQLANDIDKMVSLRIAITKKVMAHFKMGNYQGLTH